MSNTAENFSVAARDPNPSFGHWSTYLKEGKEEGALRTVRTALNSVAIPYQPDETDFPAKLTNDDMAMLLAMLATENRLGDLDKVLQAGVPIDIRDKTRGRGLTALQISAGCLDQQRMEALLERGANPEIRDRGGRSALDHVVTSEKLSTRTHSNFLRRLMHKGSWESDRVRESIQILAARGADLYAQNADGHTAFANAILYLKPEAVKAFLDMADAGEFDLSNGKVSENLTAEEFCHGYSQGIARGEVPAPEGLFEICYHTDVEINIRQHEADCDRQVQEIRAQREAGTCVPPSCDHEML